LIVAEAERQVGGLSPDIGLALIAKASDLKVPTYGEGRSVLIATASDLKGLTYGLWVRLLQ
jgi:hypothetical protein